MCLGLFVRLWTSILQVVQCQACRGEGARWTRGGLLPSRRLSDNPVTRSLVGAFEHQDFGNTDSQTDRSCNSPVGEGLLSLPRLLHASRETQPVREKSFQFTTPTHICCRMCGMWGMPPRLLYGVHSPLAWRSELCWVSGQLEKWASLRRPEAPPTCGKEEMEMLQKMRLRLGTHWGLLPHDLQVSTLLYNSSYTGFGPCIWLTKWMRLKTNVMLVGFSKFGRWPSFYLHPTSY